MSKLLPFLVAAAGASTVSVGGVFMLKKGGGGGNSSPDTSNKDTSQPKEPALHANITSFKQSNGDSCVHELFGKNLNMTAANGDGASSTFPGDDAQDYFGTAPGDSEDASTTTSCLLINWKKSTKDSKWSGVFTWSWSFMNKQKGFIIFGIAETSTTPQQLDLKGVTYFLSQENSAWAIKKHKEVSSGHQVAQNDNEFEQKLPKAGSDIQSTLTDTNDKAYWGFMNGKESLNQICENSQCPTDSTPITSHHFKWSWQKGIDKQMTSWCEKLDWWGKLFGATNFDLSTKLSTFKGTWNKPQ